MISMTRAPTALLAILLLAACANTTPYQPLKSGVGYSDQKLEANRFRVSFDGKSSTPRATVENYVLYRSAEVTLANSYDYFTVAMQNTESKVNGNSSPFSFGIGGFGRNGGVGFGVGTGSDIRSEYQGSADVTMFRGKKPEDNPHAYDARAIKENLESTVARPKPDA